MRINLAETARKWPSTAEWPPGADDGRPERENMEICNKLIPCCGCADMEKCTKKKNNLMTLKDVIKENKSGKYLAVCDDGEYYNAEYSALYRTMFFAINSEKNIIGYFKKGR